MKYLSQLDSCSYSYLSKECFTSFLTHLIRSIELEVKYEFFESIRLFFLFFLPKKEENEHFTSFLTHFVRSKILVF